MNCRYPWTAYCRRSTATSETGGFPMKAFKYRRAGSLAEAVALLADPHIATVPLAGGTDLLGTMKDNIHPDYPEILVDIKRMGGPGIYPPLRWWTGNRRHGPLDGPGFGRRNRGTIPDAGPGRPVRGFAPDTQHGHHRRKYLPGTSLLVLPLSEQLLLLFAKRRPFLSGLERRQPLPRHFRRPIV